MNLHTIRSFDTKMKPEQSMAMARSVFHFACFLVLLFAAAAVKAQEPAPPPIPKLEPPNSLARVPTSPTRAQKLVQQGIAIEFTVDPQLWPGQAPRMPKMRAPGRCRRRVARLAAVAHDRRPMRHGER